MNWTRLFKFFFPNFLPFLTIFHATLWKYVPNMKKILVRLVLNPFLHVGTHFQNPGFGYVPDPSLPSPPPIKVHAQFERACHAYYLKLLLARNELIHHAKVLKNKCKWTRSLLILLQQKKILPICLGRLFTNVISNVYLSVATKFSDLSGFF